MTLPDFCLGSFVIPQANALVNLTPLSVLGFIYFVSLIILVIFAFCFPIFVLFTIEAILTCKRGGKLGGALIALGLSIVGVSGLYTMAHMSSKVAAQIAQKTIGVEYTSDKYDFRDAINKRTIDAEQVKNTPLENKLVHLFNHTAANNSLSIGIRTLKTVSYLQNKNKQVETVFIQITMANGEKAIISMSGIETLMFLAGLETCAYDKPGPGTPKPQNHWDNEKRFENSTHIN